ncbi:3-oxoacyl-[acyl-carrier protein] reductase [Cystobacter fuscus DSM 2262]|uniref:3-oxoacyl-[acyl-carrier protein] reductase n=1 Tax=Cystobacter fuscus (strain ATCC 25194 / DSM 2262 / NBRC 100088 / M29) TaxID=1242864 RepID=S9QQA0_CYSF2|nr:glucose 1-dehydrogenase [Cystobacter fuscus]EPX58778.1 3-oxoacyl-[acyl-carrier protein] reductase [Cystobacter fuscus DSM 2262]
MGRVEGRTAIVTGGGKGMGAATVRLLAAEGANVIAADVDIASAEALAGELGPKVTAATLDVRSPESWSAVVDGAERRFGTVDILVNNAGIADPGELKDWDLARMQRMLDVNLIGVFNGVQAVAPGMRKLKRGSIVNIGSVGGFQGIPRMSGYVIAKWGVRGLTKTAALELGPYGIRVNAVHPGQTRTPMTADVVFDTSGIALGRVGEPEDIARAVLFFASDDSSFVTGAELAVDGGQLAGPADYSGLPR